LPIELFEQCVREQLADEFASYQPPTPTVLDFDKWVLRSLLQKALRRDEPDWAIPAAASLLRIDPAGLWRRLLVVGYEDLSLGDLALLSQLVAARSKRWRASVVDEWTFVAYLVERLCAAPKCRAPNNLIEIAKYDPAIRASARNLTHMPFEDVLTHAITGLSLPDRLTATASLYGRSSEFEPHPEADTERVISTLLGEAPPALVYCVSEGLVATRLDHPLAMAVLFKAMPQEPRVTADDSFPPVSLVRGIPAYAFDMHTRAGAAAIRSFVRQAREVREALRSSGVPERGWFELVRHCVFDLETGLVKRRVIDPVSLDLRRHAETVGYGRTPENALAIMGAIRASWSLYADLRSSLAGAS